MTTEAIDQRITRFIRKHHLLTLATCSGGKPWVASCFYVWMPEESAFIITTDPETLHGRQASENPHVAGSVAWETNLIGRIQGIQFTATIEQCSGNLKALAEQAYLKRFPVARLMDMHLWILRPDLLKMTHNLLGFGTKLIWEKGSSS